MATTESDRQERLAGIVERYRAGEFSEIVFIASILALVPDRDERRYLIHIHQPAHRASMPYRRGTFPR